uniref:Uncharacterized protein n=1 Tax=white sturgeon herpesvirus 2 TaxID=320884 RepID=A0A1I9KI08_9VIRU|nr:hypothetical protein [Acipenserid herpesvirus 2]
MWILFKRFFTHILEWLKLTIIMALNWTIDPNDLDECEGTDDWSDSWDEETDDEKKSVVLPPKMPLLNTVVPLKSYDTVVDVSVPCGASAKKQLKSILKKTQQTPGCQKHCRKISFSSQPQIFKYETSKLDNVNKDYRQKCMFKMVAPQILTDPFNNEGLLNFFKNSVERAPKTPTVETTISPKLDSKHEDECIDLIQFLSEYS